jgi:pimeloyl-ACP methyl ester carboxylesterase
MTTYVLVHGAWSGAYTFRAVRRQLQEAGHEVFTPALTGLGDRVHLLSPQVSLATHVEDVVNLVVYEDLTDIVLLGFSYGGVVVVGALEFLAPRVRHLVFLDAFVPGDGQSLAALHQSPELGTGIGAPWVLEVPGPLSDPALSDEFFAERVSPHPARTHTEAVRLSRPLEEFDFTRTYIKATDPPHPDNAERQSAFWRAADHAKSSPAWRYREIATNHFIPVNRPDELTALLLELS